LLVALSRLRRIDPLLQTIVSRHQKFLDAIAGVVPLHKSTLTSQISPGSRGALEAAVNTPHKIRVLIADDHRLFSQALEAILATDERLEVTGHAGDGAEAVQLALSLDPDVILMDIAMPVMDGFEATKQIRKQRPQSRVLMLTGSNARTDVDRARKAGAAGYVTKDRIAAELIDAILEVVSR
jgi:CheY-like chemotaxis protein